MSEDTQNEKSKSIAERLGLKTPREAEADKRRAWTHIHQPGLTEVEAPKPPIDLAGALAKLGSMVNAPTSQETELLIRAFRAGELEKFAPDRLAPIGDQEDFKRKLR